MNASRPAIAAALAVAVLGLTGCGSSDDTAAQDPGSGNTSSTGATSDSGPSTPETSSDDMGGMDMSDMVMIEIMDFRYMGPKTAEPAELVMVTNDDSEAHTLTSDDAGMFTVTVQPGGTETFDAPTKPGSYTYHCDFHANMHGSLVVK